jgi:hypothetical protein
MHAAHRTRSRIQKKSGALNNRKAELRGANNYELECDA